MLMAVAIALLLAQGFSALLVYRAQAERRDIVLAHALAFRLLSVTRTNHIPSREPDPISARFPEVPRTFTPERTAVDPIQPADERDPKIEQRLREVLSDQDFATDALIVVRREAEADPFTIRRFEWEARIMKRRVRRSDGGVLLAVVRRPDQSEWLVARVMEPTNESLVVRTLVAQTLFLYLVVVGAIAFILRRITRPLAALTDRVERFAETRDPAGRLDPQGPDDVRRLMIAHNAMEDRISALLDEKDVMLGAIGHDLKTPLAALRVRIETVEDESERGRMAATIEDIVHTLDDILSLARVGRPSDPCEPFELSALVAAVVEEYEDMGESVRLGDTQRMVLPLRATWLRRALRNLIGNALRYGGTADVSLSRERGRATIRIDDEGPGIPESAMGRMLDPFTRGEPSRNTETGGAGLGLALARAIAEQHGGELRLTNRHRADGSVAGLRAELVLPLG